MGKWLVRGLTYAVVMVVLRLIQGVLINAFEAETTLISWSLMGLFVIAVMVWGYFDGRADAKANPDPDRREDLAMTWLSSGLAAGLLSGLVTWVIAHFDKALYAGTLFSELTSFAAFTTLMVFVPAVAAVTLGRRRIDKVQATLMSPRHHGLAAGGPEPATDVFATVGAPMVAQDASEAIHSAAEPAMASSVVPADASALDTAELAVVDPGTAELESTDSAPSEPDQGETETLAALSAPVGFTTEELPAQDASSPTETSESETPDSETTAEFPPVQDNA